MALSTLAFVAGITIVTSHVISRDILSCLLGRNLAGKALHFAHTLLVIGALPILRRHVPGQLRGGTDVLNRVFCSEPVLGATPRAAGQCVLKSRGSTCSQANPEGLAFCSALAFPDIMDFGELSMET